MTRAPEAIDALEVRLAANVECWHDTFTRTWRIKAAGHPLAGVGRTLPQAINDLLLKMGLTP